MGIDDELEAQLAVVARAESPPIDPLALERFAPTTEDFAVPLEKLADPRFLGLVEQRLRPEIVRAHHLPTYIGELPHHLDPVDWRTGFLQVHEGGPPPELREAMKEFTPQALLRDLYRSVRSEAPVALDFVELPLDPGGRGAMAELAAAKEREPLPKLLRMIDLVAELQADWRSFMRTPWAPHLPDDQPRREVFVAIEPSLSA